MSSYWVKKRSTIFFSKTVILNVLSSYLDLRVNTMSNPIEVKREVVTVFSFHWYSDLSTDMQFIQLSPKLKENYPRLNFRDFVEGTILVNLVCLFKNELLEFVFRYFSHTSHALAFLSIFSRASMYTNYNTKKSNCVRFQ